MSGEVDRHSQELVARYERDVQSPLDQWQDHLANVLQIANATLAAKGLTIDEATRAEFSKKFAATVSIEITQMPRIRKNVRSFNNLTAGSGMALSRGISTGNPALGAVFAIGGLIAAGVQGSKLKRQLEDATGEVRQSVTELVAQSEYLVRGARETKTLIELFAACRHSLTEHAHDLDRLRFHAAEATALLEMRGVSPT